MKIGLNLAFMVMQSEQRTNQAPNGELSQETGDAGEGLQDFHIFPRILQNFLHADIFFLIVILSGGILLEPI